MEHKYRQQPVQERHSSFNNHYAEPSRGRRDHSESPSAGHQEVRHRPSHGRHPSRDSTEQRSRPQGRGRRASSSATATSGNAARYRPGLHSPERRPSARGSKKVNTSRSAKKQGGQIDGKILLGVGRCAFKAGAMAAHKVRNDPGPWVGPKGAKVAAVALGAAAVDVFLELKHPDYPDSKKNGLRYQAIRRAAQLAIGVLVTTPAANYSRKNMPRAKESVRRMGPKHRRRHEHT